MYEWTEIRPLLYKDGYMGKFSHYAQFNTYIFNSSQYSLSKTSYVIGR